MKGLTTRILFLAPAFGIGTVEHRQCSMAWQVRNLLLSSAHNTSGDWRMKCRPKA